MKAKDIKVSKYQNFQIKEDYSKIQGGKGLNNCISLSQWHCADSQLGLWKSVSGILTQPSSRNNLEAEGKGNWKKERWGVVDNC